MLLKPDEIHHLSLFEECAGILRELRVINGLQTALIDRINFAVSPDLEKSLRPLIGQRIAILRTDIPNKPYFFRILTDETNHAERDRLEG